MGPSQTPLLNTKRGRVPAFGDVTTEKLKEWGHLDRGVSVDEADTPPFLP